MGNRRDERAKGSTATHAPVAGTTEASGRLRVVLRQMFQLDREDLDFGLYRIMNLKRAEVEGFLGEDLLPQAQALLGVAIRKGREKRLADAEEQARGLGFDPADCPRFGNCAPRREGVSGGRGR